MVNSSPTIKFYSALSDPSILKYGLPQGLVLGRIVFPSYTDLLAEIISPLNSLKYYFCADDNQKFTHYHGCAVSHLEKCLSKAQQ